MLQDNEKKGSRQAMKEDIITKILARDNLNEAFKNVKANKGASGIDDLSIEETAEYIRQNKATIVWQLYNRKYQLVLLDILIRGLLEKIKCESTTKIYTGSRNKLGSKIGDLPTEIKEEFKEKYRKYQEDILKKW